MGRSKMTNKILRIITMMFLPFLLTGCFDYADINRVTFATSTIFDIDDIGRIVVYLDCVKPYRSTNESSDKGRRLIYKGVGRTVSEALSDIGSVSSYKINYSQNRAYIFTEKAAREGIKNYLDVINSKSQFQMKPSAFVYYGDVEDLLQTTSNDEEYLGLFLSDLVQNSENSYKAVQSNINYYLSNLLMGSGDGLLASIKLKDDLLDRKVEISGASIFKDNVLEEKMDFQECLFYNMFFNDVKGATLEVGNPLDDGEFITLQVLSNSGVDSLELKDGSLKYLKNIEIKVSLEESQGKLIVDKKILDYITTSKEAYINSRIEEIFNNYKEKGLDVFDVKRLAEIHYSEENIEDPLSITEMVVNTKIKISGTGVAQDSL